MLPLSLLTSAKGNPMLIELKNGDTYNGRLVNADTWMNINLEDVICTSREGDRFWKLNECYIRGTAIKYLRIPDEIIDMVADDEAAKEKKNRFTHRGRGRVNTHGGRGRGRGGRGRGRNDGRGGGDSRGGGRGPSRGRGIQS